MPEEFRSEMPETAVRPAKTGQESTGRMYLDCRQIPSDSHCSLTIAGRPDEVLEAAYEHAIKVHGHQPGEATREATRAALKPVPAGDMTLA